MKQQEPVTIRYQWVSNRGVETRQKRFTSQAAMERWTAKQERENGDYLGVIAYSYAD